MCCRQQWYPPPHLISHSIQSQSPRTTGSVPLSEPSTFSPIAAEDGTYYGGRQETNLMRTATQQSSIMLDFETQYYWGELIVQLVPMFGFKKYKAWEDELVWVFDTNNTKNSYHVPARNLSTYSY